MTADVHLVPGATIGTGAATVLASLLEARTGQVLGANRAWRIETALRPLLAELKLDSADALVRRLLEGQDTGVGDRIVDALLNQETSFFRDAGVLEAAVAALRADAVPGRRQRIWSAACASGQEPLSLAMLLAEHDAGGAMPEIVATDVSAGAIARARAGSYSQFEVQRGLPVRRLLRWFGGGGMDARWTALPALLQLVNYRRQHLVAQPAPAGAFDLVLCRNVLFYLSPAARAQALERVAAALRPGGLLVLGAGETVIGQSDRFRPSLSHRGFYRRRDDAAPMSGSGAQ